MCESPSPHFVQGDNKSSEMAHDLSKARVAVQRQKPESYPKLFPLYHSHCRTRGSGSLQVKQNKKPSTHRKRLWDRSRDFRQNRSRDAVQFNRSLLEPKTLVLRSDTKSVIADVTLLGVRGPITSSLSMSPATGYTLFSSQQDKWIRLED